MPEPTKSRSVSPPVCSVAEAPGQHADLLAVYEREDAIKAAAVCPVCRVRYDAPRLPSLRDGRYIQNVVDCDSWETYSCPGCCPDEYRAEAERDGDRPYEIERMLAKAARDVAAGRRL